MRGVGSRLYRDTGGRGRGARVLTRVTAGEVTSTSARLWARPNRSGPYFLQLTRGAAGGRCERGPRVVARPEHDNTVQLQVRGLRPDTDYSYRFCSGLRSSETGHFLTAPAPSSTDTVRFGLTADLDGLYRNGRPAWNRFEVLGAMAREAFDFNVNLGDVIYADSVFRLAPRCDASRETREVPAEPPLRQLPAFPRGNRAVLALGRSRVHQRLLGAGVRPPALQERRHGLPGLQPDHLLAHDRIYRSFRWGANLEIFLLDLRSFRSASAGARGRCEPHDRQARHRAHASDQRAPAPGEVPAGSRGSRPGGLHGRNRGSRAHDAGIAPVPALCPGHPGPPPAAFKMILSPAPVQQLDTVSAGPLGGLRAGPPAIPALPPVRRSLNVVFLSTDAHAAFTNEVFLRTLEPGGPVSTGMREAIAGPVASLTFSGALGVRHLPDAA